MTSIIVYDTETTGLPDFRAPSEAPHQPHLVQLAAAIVDTDTWEILSSIDLMIQPDGWEIPSDVANIHGITTEMASDLGVPEADAVEMLVDMVGKRTRVAHNENFDARIIRIAQKRYNFLDSIIDWWKTAPTECTATLSTPLCKLPPTEKMKAAGRHHFKTPNLQEAHQHFLGVGFDNAHSAMADVRACISIYRCIKTRGAQ